MRWENLWIKNTCVHTSMLQTVAKQAFWMWMDCRVRASAFNKYIIVSQNVWLLRAMKIQQKIQFFLISWCFYWQTWPQPIKIQDFPSHELYFRSWCASMIGYKLPDLIWSGFQWWEAIFYESIKQYINGLIF